MAGNPDKRERPALPSPGIPDWLMADVKACQHRIIITS